MDCSTVVKRGVEAGAFHSGAEGAEGRDSMKERHTFTLDRCMTSIVGDEGGGISAV